MTFPRHICSQNLSPAQVTVSRPVGIVTLRLALPGERCSVCGETFIHRNTLREVELDFVRVDTNTYGTVVTSWIPEVSVAGLETTDSDLALASPRISA